MIALEAAIEASTSNGTAIIVALIAALGSILTALITIGQRRKVAETHRQLTVNHHSSDFPTVLDRIDDVKQLVLEQGKRLSDHIDHSNEMDHQFYALRDRQEAPSDRSPR